MSLLDRGPHLVQVEVAHAGVDAYNDTKITYAEPVEVRCSVQPVRAEEAAGLGVTPDTAYKVLCRSWPGSIRSKVTWRGRTWFQHGETLHHGMSPRTAHDVAVIVALSAEVK